MDVGHVRSCAAYVTLKGPYIEKKIPESITGNGYDVDLPH